jgi:two-component system, chemotaxis family, chemotaxis protein CheY
MIKAVVIDANAISRNLLTSVLVNGGFDVIGDANISSAGLAAAIKLQPQLVCIDIGATDDEAFARLQTVRDGLPKALLFMVSAKFDANTVQTAVAQGVHGFIVKPFNAGTVLATIRRTVLRLAQQHRKAGAPTTPASPESSPPSATVDAAPDGDTAPQPSSTSAPIPAAADADR